MKRKVATCSCRFLAHFGGLATQAPPSRQHSSHMCGRLSCHCCPYIYVSAEGEGPAFTCIPGRFTSIPQGMYPCFPPFSSVRISSSSDKSSSQPTKSVAPLPSASHHARKSSTDGHKIIPATLPLATSLLLWSVYASPMTMKSLTLRPLRTATPSCARV
jgi:hypothetical protein